MSGAPEEPPDEHETAAGPSEATQLQATHAKDVCEDNKSQLETFKDIMLKNKNDLRKKEEELQEYASKLSEIKSRAKLSRRSKDGGSSSVETTPKSTVERSLPEGDTVDDISQATTPKAKSSLLQRKLAENRKVFEKRSKEMTASKRAVEEKVEAIRQQMDQTDMTIVEAHRDSLTVTPVRPVLITQIVPTIPVQMSHFQDKDNKIAELSNRILELEATVIDLQDNLKEKDSVIESKTKAVTLMSADLSKKGKTTLDTLEETKDEMRTMQENFVLIETSLKGKNENLLEQLQERNDKVVELETAVTKYQQEMEEKLAADSASANLSRSTMDTLTDTKDAMRSMQENFVLIETSLKDKIENLLQQLQERETKLAEAEEKMYKLESGAGIVSAPEIPDLQYKIDRLDQSNRALQDEKYELQKSIAELQEKIVTRESTNSNGLILEKDNRIAELENLIEELKSSNQLLEEESKAELQKQITDLTTTNDEFRNKIDDLEKINNDLDTRMNELRAKIPDDSVPPEEDAIVKKLTKELDDSNKSMIKLKAQHKGKLRNLQRQLESFRNVSDANAELVKLGNQVALLEEEKGNLQLSLVDFDELKALAGDWQDRIADLESKVSAQTNDIHAHIEAVAILENQKLDLMQELHTVKQEISALEEENAESENLRVTAEIKVVDLEEQLESVHRLQNEKESSETEVNLKSDDLLSKIERLTQENSELLQKVTKLEEKPSSEAGSTESFETIHEDRNEMLKKIEALSLKNSELEEKLAKLEESARSNVGSTESFETINDTDKSELLKKIELLSRENRDLVTKLNKFEEKGSSDTGSTESFEKIPEHGESLSRIEALTRENNELVIKLTKLEEKYENLESQKSETLPVSSEMEEKMENLTRENYDLVIELTKSQEKLSRVTDEKEMMEKREVSSTLADKEEAPDLTPDEELKTQINALTAENNELVIKFVKLEEKNIQLSENLEKLATAELDNEKMRSTAEASSVTVASLENEIEKCRKLLTEQTELIDEMKMKIADQELELEGKIERINEYENASISIEQLQRELKESFGVVDEWKFKCVEMERKMEILEAGKISIEEGLAVLQKENNILIEQSKQNDVATEALKQELNSTITTFETRLEEERASIIKQEEELTFLRQAVETRNQEYLSLQTEMKNFDDVQDELNICKTQLQQNETIIASLNEEIAKLNDLVDSSKEETISVQAEIIVLREELQSKAVKEAKNEELSQLLSDKENLAEEMKAIINEQLKDNAELRNIIENANSEIDSLRAILTEKESERASIETALSTHQENLRALVTDRAEAEGRLELLQSHLDEANKCNEDLKFELNDAYKLMELLKAKHTEDVEMQNRRLEDLVEDLNGKSTECEVLKTELENKSSELKIIEAELQEKTNIVQELEQRTLNYEIMRSELAEKEKMIGQNVTEQVKIALEIRVSELEKLLEESEANTQTQLQKRKILAANLKKKSSEAAEHETKATEFESKLMELEPKIAEYETKTVELEEKWISEKSEKEAVNLRIQEMQSVVEDRDLAIVQLEEQLQRAQREAVSASERVEELSNELDKSSEKINSLMDQTTELGEEVDKLRLEIELRSSEIESERSATAKIIAEHESSRQKIAEEDIHRQQVLEEAKEKARELGVRMQVMETEYVDQLNTIQMLRTENGMLSSEQVQISERLENAEKEAAEVKILLEQLQRENAARETESLQQQEPPTSEDDQADDSKTQTSPPCDQCDQCQTVVQALEAKLQERDAEIENLDNELANSIGNFVHMRESLRVSDLMNQSSSRNRSLEDARDNTDLVHQYNALTTSNSEIRDQLNVTIQENQELKEKIAGLQALNGALEERTGAVEAQLVEGREATTRLHTVDALHEELAEKCRLRESELQATLLELESLKQQHEEWMTGMRSQVEQLESENRQLTSKYDDLVRTNDIVEREVTSLRDEVDRCERNVIELETKIERYKEENSKLVEESSKPAEKPELSASVFFEHIDDSPQLFDAAKVFGSSVTSDSAGRKEITDLRNNLALKDTENIQLAEEIRRLGEQLVNQQFQCEQSIANCKTLENELKVLEQHLVERNRQIDGLNSELSNVGAQPAMQFDQHGNTDALESVIAELRAENEDQSSRLSDKENTVDNLTSVNAELAGQLQNLERENHQYSSSMNVVSLALKNLGELLAGNISCSDIDEVSPIITQQLNEVLHSLVDVEQERNRLLTVQEHCRLRILTLERDAENLNDLTRLQELEERVDKITRERDIKQLQVNDLTRSLEEMQETAEKAASNEESRLRNLQAALDEALDEHDRLKVQLQTIEHEREANKQSETEKPVETAEIPSSQSLQPSEIEASSVTDLASGWDDEAKIEGDEEIWSWNPEDAQTVADHELLAATPLQPSLEITLKTRIAELEDTIKDLESERDKLVEEAQITQLRSAKLVKKLKEFKIQNEGLQRQLKIQKASCDFGDLDSAIEEELKSQINSLEKSLSEANEERKKTVAERENLNKRIDVLSAANERLVEMKERQDMEVQVLQIRTKDMANKLEAVEWQFKQACGDETEIPAAISVESQVEQRRTETLQSAASQAAPGPSGFECLCKKYKEEIDELRDEMEALAAENEQLQQLLEDQKITRQSAESKFTEELSSRDKHLEELTTRKGELENQLEVAKKEQENLREQYECSVKKSDEETSVIKQSQEMLQLEIAEKTNAFEAQIAVMRKEIEEAGSQVNALQENLETLVLEKQELIERTKSHEETKDKLSILSDSMAEVTDLLNSRVQEVAELKQEMQKLKVDRIEALDTVEDLAQNHTRELTEKQQEAQRYLLQCETQLMEKSQEIISLEKKLHETQVESAKNAAELNEKNQENLELRDKLTEVDSERMVNAVHVQNLRDEIERLNAALTESRLHRESLQSELAGKEQHAFSHEDEVRKYNVEIERLNDVVAHIQKSAADSIDEAHRKIREIEESEISLKKKIAELSARESESLAQMYREISEKDGKVAFLQQTVSNLEQKMQDISIGGVREKIVRDLTENVNNLPVCRMMGDDRQELQKHVEELRAELNRKSEEIEDYKYQLSENTYPSIIQALQDQVNQLYEEKAQLEKSLEIAMENSREEQSQKEHLAEILRQENQRQLENQREIEELRRHMSESRSEDILAATLSVKDTEIRNLKVEIEERSVSFRELHDHYESAEIEMNELRISIASKDGEIGILRTQLETTSKECELLQRALKKELPIEALEASGPAVTSTIDATREQSANELDVALYMLHQRDVRVEELTHELMQLLEERDTLQLRLSNAIRINEELRRSTLTDDPSNENLHDIGDNEPLVEKPSPSKSVGPVEIAKEALDSPSEEKIALAQKILSPIPKSAAVEELPSLSSKVDYFRPKAVETLIAVGEKLSQLHNMGHRRDIRLMDERELRHNQQMSLLAHRDVLNTLPPEAAARLVNANYTLCSTHVMEGRERYDRRLPCLLDTFLNVNQLPKYLACEEARNLLDYHPFSSPRHSAAAGAAATEAVKISS